MQRPRYGWREFLGSFWINPLRFPDFAWVWSSRFLLFTGVALLMTYQDFYLIHQLGCPPAAVPRWIFLSTLVQSGAVAVSSVVGGGLSDASGRRKAFVCSTALIYALALLMIAFATSYTLFLVAMAITGIAQGGYLAADLALVTDVLPERETHAARNFGIFNIASVMPQSLMPAIAPGILLASGGSLQPCSPWQWSSLRLEPGPSCRCVARAEEGDWPVFATHIDRHESAAPIVESWRIGGGKSILATVAAGAVRQSMGRGWRHVPGC